MQSFDELAESIAKAQPHEPYFSYGEKAQCGRPVARFGYNYFVDYVIDPAGLLEVFTRFVIA